MGDVHLSLSFIVPERLEGVKVGVAVREKNVNRLQ